MTGRRLLLAAALVLCACAAWAAVQAMSVQVKQAQLRAQPTFLSPVVGSAAYGQRVFCEEEKGDWLAVLGPNGDRGWLHRSALTEKTIEMSAGDATAGASGEEMVLAGKGFNKQVEDSYRANHGGLGYKFVDQAEKDYPVSQEQLLAFLQAGGLDGQGGAQ